MNGRQEERMYLLLDSVNHPLARGRLEGPAAGDTLQLMVMDNDVDKVACHEVIVLMSMSGSEPPLQCRIVRQRGDRIALEKSPAWTRISGGTCGFPLNSIHLSIPSQDGGRAGERSSPLTSAAAAWPFTGTRAWRSKSAWSW